jgi:Ca2+-binding RTX toxin-like protein
VEFDMATIRGTSGRNTLIGKASSDLILGFSGDDVLKGGNGNDTLQGAAGADRLFGETGDDQLEGGKGADILNGGAGNDAASYVRSAQGVTINLATGAASGGEAAGDKLSSIEGVLGSRFGDQLTGSAADNALSGNSGNDVLHGLSGNDLLEGGNGNDKLYGEEEDDILIGGEGDDELYGGAGDDTLRPGAGDDRVDGGGGFNTVDYSDAAGGIFLLLESGTAGGAAFGDTLFNIQRVIGSAYNDVIAASGSGTPESIDGGGGDDTLIAGTVDGERLIGGLGKDQLIGAADSADDFQLQRDRGTDYITGFDNTNATVTQRDQLVIAGDEFGIGSALDPSELVTVLDGAGPQLLQQASGSDLLIYFDSDGEASANGLVLVARLTGVASVSVADFVVI